MRLRNWLCYGTALPALLLASACGDDDENVDPDAEVDDPDAEVADDPDAAADDPDAGPGEADFSTDESGMVFFERIVNAEGEEDVPLGRITVNFVEPIAAATAPTPEPGGNCIDAWYETSEYWPADWPDDTTSLDVGQVTIQADGLEPFEQEPYSIQDGDNPPRDFLSRQNDLAIAEQIEGQEAVDVMGEGDTFFDVSVAGSDTYPETTWEDAIYMPSQPTLTPSPDQQIDLVDGLNEDGELVLTYESGDNENLPEGALPLNFVGFAKPSPDEGDDGAYSTKVCLSPSTGNELVIDADTVEELRSEGVVAAVRGQLVHQIDYMEEDNPEAGRSDMVGLNCFLNTVKSQE